MIAKGERGRGKIPGGIDPSNSQTFTTETVSSCSPWSAMAPPQDLTRAAGIGKSTELVQSRPLPEWRRTACTE